ncbi:hypothetical protein EB810_10545 [Altererythrobacter sp. FM1]|nr:hypothetical protein EB810_10545 [Altererythrobacter sp. FM1]
MDCHVALRLLAMTRGGGEILVARPLASPSLPRHPGPRAGVQLPLAPRWKKSGAPDQVRGDGVGWSNVSHSSLRAWRSNPWDDGAASRNRCDGRRGSGHGLPRRLWLPAMTRGGATAGGASHIHRARAKLRLALAVVTQSR